MAQERITNIAKAAGDKVYLPGLILCTVASMPNVATATADVTPERIQLQLSPRVCTLSAHDEQCDTVVRARWRAPQEESLCLVIVDRPEVKQCWEHYEAGEYTVELVFKQDLTFQLRDPGLQQVLASEVLRVIKEAILYRHKRRQPWNIFD